MAKVISFPKDSDLKGKSGDNMGKAPPKGGNLEAEWRQIEELTPTPAPLDPDEVFILLRGDLFQKIKDYAKSRGITWDAALHELFNQVLKRLQS